MKLWMLLLVVSILAAVPAAAVAANADPAPSAAAALRGTVTDPSGAVVPGAVVQLQGPAGDRRTRTDSLGQYSFSGLVPGKYVLHVMAKGFTLAEKRDLDVGAATTADVQLSIEAEAQVVDVKDSANEVSTAPDQNGTAVVLKEKELETLSDDPDELQQQLQAMAGPAAGPNGGQIYIDGFTGGNLPPKSSIREVRINSNPFSPEYDHPGFSRIEIFTKPGTDNIRGQAFIQYNKEALDARSPLLAQSQRPPFQQHFYNLNITGPIKKQKVSFGFNFERRANQEDAFIYANTLDSNLHPLILNTTILTPQTRTNITPRLDYSINSKNTLTLRYQRTTREFDNEGVGDFSLASRAYRQTVSEHTVQATETAAPSTTLVNETRFQYQRVELSNVGDNSIPALSVQGAFNAGGAQIGHSGNLSNRWEVSNISSWMHNRHFIKWGARARQDYLNDTSVSNFGGTFSFFGGAGPMLDANNQAIAGTLIQLSALERYRRTLLFQQLGYTPAQIRMLGGGASQFTIAGGLPTTSVSQFDLGLFWNDDFKVRPNFTLSYGVRYETQSNISDFGDWAPRVGFAWGIDGGGNKAPKTVLRGGFGIFYNRLSDSLTLSALRFNGLTQQSYFIRNPDFFPTVPALSTLAAGQQPQSLQEIYSGIVAPQIMQTSLGIDRAINRYFRLSAAYVNSRGIHLQRSRNINSPIDGAYPFGDSEVRLLTESVGLSRVNQVFISPNLNYKKLFLFGYYAHSTGRSNAEGMPADPYNLNAEWGPSGYADVHHRVVVGTSLPLPRNITIFPFFSASSGAPYNITTGLDTNGDGFTTERPALITTIAQANCQGGSLFFAPGFGCFDLKPAPGVPAIGRNFGRGPASFNLNLRVAKTWGFGSKGESGLADRGGPPPGMDRGGPRGGGGGGGPRGGGPMMMGGGPMGGMRGVFGGGQTAKRYNLTLTLSAMNILNHPNYATPSGDLSSPFFGVYRSLASVGYGPGGGGPPPTYNRKVDVQLRFMF